MGERIKKRGVYHYAPQFPKAFRITSEHSDGPNPNFNY